MKQNISIITNALLIILIPFSVYIGITFVAGLAGIVNKVPEMANSFISRNFYALTPPSDAEISLFLIGYAAVMTYLFVSVNNLRLTFSDIAKKGTFSHGTSDRLYKAGIAIIRFAFLKYALFGIFGALCLSDIFSLFSEFVPLIVFSLCGKFILIIAGMAEQGEILLEETELTI